MSAHHQHSPCIHQRLSRGTVDRNAAVTLAFIARGRTRMQTHTATCRCSHMSTEWCGADGDLCFHYSRCGRWLKRPGAAAPCLCGLDHNWFTCLLTGCRPAQEIAEPENIQGDNTHCVEKRAALCRISGENVGDKGRGSTLLQQLSVGNLWGMFVTVTIRALTLSLQSYLDVFRSYSWLELVICRVLEEWAFLVS